MSIKFFQDDALLTHGGAATIHGFFSRNGGVSEKPYKTLNCGVGSNDLRENVHTNLERVANQLGVKSKNVICSYQIHGSAVHYVDRVWDKRPKGDALITDVAGLALGVVTADCAPVLFSGQKDDGSPVIAAAHAGWKGALSGVLDNVISEMVKYGADANMIRACVGPCISKSSYEVSDDFISPFIKESDESERFFHASSKVGRAFFDLSGYCAWRLSRKGVRNVSLMDMDTYQNENEFFSYRRSTHRNEGDYGRQISVIAINAQDKE